MIIASKEQLEAAALHYGVLPFFNNRIPEFSVEEMAAPGMLFGEATDDYGCWDWKGHVIREQTTAYGKFFRRKAGFVSLELLPDFINYRRKAYPLEAGSVEAMILDIVRRHEGITSSELKKIVFGATSLRLRKPTVLADFVEAPKPKRHSLEGPLQRLQMGCWLLIADFEYKHTVLGDRYGWGVALYSTPEIWFGEGVTVTSHTPEESFASMVTSLSEKLPGVPACKIEELLR